jgi:hypothetical protein
VGHHGCRTDPAESADSRHGDRAVARHAFASESAHNGLRHRVRGQAVVERARLGRGLAGPDAGHELGFDRTGRDQRDLHAAPADFTAKAVSESLHREFRRAVHGLARRGHVSGDGADVDDVPAAPFEHPRQDPLREVDDREHVDLEQLPDLVGGHGLDHALPAEPGVVHEHVDGLALLDECGAVGVVRHVTGRGHDLGMLGRERVESAFVASGGKDPRPLSREA